MENIFFDVACIGRRGRDVLIGKTARIRHPELAELGDGVIIDDFTYISTQLKTGDGVHIASGCSLIGGREALVTLGEFSTLAPGVVLAAGSDDYHGGLATPMIPPEYKGAMQVGHIKIARHSIVGANSVVVPDVVFGEGAVLGALSLAKDDLEPWGIYAGVPARRIGERDKHAILALEARYKESINRGA
jgi:acetyltransferase-like isoleucine patch superfamily enzyme